MTYYSGPGHAGVAEGWWHLSLFPSKAPVLPEVVSNVMLGEVVQSIACLLSDDDS